MKTKAKRRHRLSALVAVLCIAAILASFAGLTAFAQTSEDLTSGDFVYRVLSEEDKTCEIIYYTGSATVLDIPAQLDGYTVTSLASASYDLTQVTIPDSVTSIGDWAFSDCSRLTRIDVDSQNPAYSSKDGVLFNKAQTELIQYPIGKTDTSYTIPQGVTSIGFRAFTHCNSLTQVTIPQSVTSIGDSAFSSCSSLTEVTIPGSVTSIGDFAFGNCTSLTKIDVDSQNPAYSSKNGVLFNKAQTELIQYPEDKSDASYTIPQGVTSIGVDAFEDCDNLTQVNIPDSVTSIGEYAFCGCESLMQVTIPDSVTSIGDSAFGMCNSLTQVTIPDSVTSIGNQAFCDCDSLTQVTIPGSVTSMGSQVFAYCDNLTTVTILEGVTSIGDRAFDDCESLTQVTIPGSVTSIEAWAFFYCKSLTQVTIPEGVTSIGGQAFDYCENLAQVTIPQSVTSIGDNAFGGCDSLTIYGYSGSCAENYAKENGFAFIALRDFKDADSGISITAAADALPENAELAVSVVDTARDRITYDISLQAGGKEIQPNGSVTVKIPVPETMDGANVKVYRQEADGTLTDMHAIFQDGYAVFTTDHFSRYILESKTESVQPTDPAKPTDPTQPTQPTDPANPQPGQSGTTQAPANNAHTDIPKTGSASNALAGTCAFMLAIAAVGALGLKKAYRKKQA